MKAACGCNAALYLVGMKQPSGGGSGYCDIQSSSNPCTELDMFEGSTKAFQTTIHTQCGTGCNACNQWGCETNFGGKGNNHTLYGLGSDSAVDSSKPYKVSVTFSHAGSMSVVVTLVLLSLRPSPSVAGSSSAGPARRCRGSS